MKLRTKIRICMAIVLSPILAVCVLGMWALGIILLLCSCLNFAWTGKWEHYAEGIWAFWKDLQESDNDS